VYAKFRCTPQRIEKALGILRELVTTTRRRTTITRVAFWNPPPRSKKKKSAGNLFSCGPPCDVFLETGYIWWVEFDFEDEQKGSTIFTNRSTTTQLTGI